MQERQIGLWELRRNLGKCLEEIRHGKTLLLANHGRQIARLVPATDLDAPVEESPIIKGRGRLKARKPKARLLDGGSMSDIVGENRAGCS